MAKMETVKFESWTGQSFFTIPAGASVVNDDLQVQAIPAYPSVYTTNAYDLTGSKFEAEVVQMPETLAGGYEAYIGVQVAIGGQVDELSYVWGGGWFTAYKRVGGVYTEAPSWWQFNATTHKYMGVREEAGTIYWEHSSDGVSWTTLWTQPNPFDVTTMYARLRAGNWGTETAVSTFRIGAVNNSVSSTPDPEPEPTPTEEPESITANVVPWASVTLSGLGTGSWTQTSGTTVTLGGSGATRTFVAPPSMSNQTLVFTYGIHTATIDIPRATHGIKVANGSVQPIRFSTSTSSAPAPVTVELGTSISIVADTTDVGTFVTNIPADSSDLGTFGAGLTPDTNDSGTFVVAGSSTPVASRLKPTSVTQAQMDTSTQTLWTNWKTNIVQKPENGWYAVKADAQKDPVTGISANPYVAEGQGYGLLAAVQMSAVDSSAKTIFDGITKFVLDHPSSINPAFHAAEQDANMVSHNGADSATDGDMDIAYAHLLAHKKWGSTGTYNYLQLAITRINALKASIISPVTGLLELGDWSSGTWENYSRPSDWMIGHFEAFYAATGDSAWETAKNAHVASIQRLQSTYAPVTGLLPDFTQNPPATIAPAGPNLLESANDGDYYYNACRTPWRLGVATSQTSRDAALKMATWAKTKCSGNPSTLPSGYKLDGTTIGAYQDLSFIAPFAVGASCGSDQAWLNSLWDYLAARSTNTDYYGGSIQLLCMIAISGTYVVNP